MSKPDKQHKERPILFSAPMVRAILDGRKTQTRRVVKDNHLRGCQPEDYLLSLCPYGQRGDRLWVRETWQTWKEFDRVRPANISNQAEIQYPATYDGWDSRIRLPIHMPRWASRITLKITGVRVERLQDISRGDAMAEGCPFANTADGPNPRQWYADLWEQINGEGSWDANPWVWVIEFKRVKP